LKYLHKFEISIVIFIWSL